MKKIVPLLVAFTILGVNCLLGLDNKFLRVIYESRIPAVNNIKVFDQFAYVNNDWQLYIYSLRNIWSPTIETGFASTYPITDVFSLDNNYIYICSYEPTNEVTEIDSLNTFGRIYFMNRLTSHKVKREGATLYVSHRENGLEIFDIGRGVFPQKISSFSEKWGFLDIEAKYPYLHALNDFGYVALDISDLTNPRTIGTNYEIVEGSVLAVNRNVVWVGALSTLLAIDITYPENPVIVNRYRFSSDITDIKARGDELFVSLKSSGLKILDISNTRFIREKNSFYLLTAINSIALDGDYIFLGAGNQGWFILEYR
jgi:hypothetical protein